MTVLTVLGCSCSKTSCNYRLGRFICYCAPGAREVTAVAVGYSIGTHMLGQLGLRICHVCMTGSTVVTAGGIRARKVVMTRLRLAVR